MKISDATLPEFEQEMASARKTIARVPEDKFSWKPHEKSMAMGYLATHIADMPSWAARALEADSLDLAPPDGKS